MNTSAFKKKISTVNNSTLMSFVVVFVINLLSKGVVLQRGYSVDDYVFLTSVNSGDISGFLSQGRYILAIIIGVINFIGVNVSDMFFSFGLCAIALQSVFVISMLRYISDIDLMTTCLIGGILVAHPYTAEIMTFRMALPGYCVALVFSIIALEMTAMADPELKDKVIAFFAVFAVILTYQIFINYFFTIIIAAYIFNFIHYHHDEQRKIKNQRIIILSIYCVLSSIIFVIITRISELTGSVVMTSRAKFIEMGEVVERVGLVKNSLVQIYFNSEPIISHEVKLVILVMSGISMLTIVKKTFIDGKLLNNKSAVSAFVFFAALIALVPLSIGVIILFKSWWPVPRVISHVSLIIGLIGLVANSLLIKRPYTNGGKLFISLQVFIVLSFVMSSNQVMTDQLRLNDRDRMMMNRIQSRLEMLNDYKKIKVLHIVGGTYGYQQTIKTMQGDMNISAFYVDYAKYNLYQEITGNNFGAAIGEQRILADNYCKDKVKWPALESVAIIDEIAVVCMDK